MSIRTVLTAVYSCFVFAMLSMATPAQALEPWWHEAQLDWKPFTNLVTNPTNTLGVTWTWEIQERSANGTPKFFALATIWGGGCKMFVADASANPTFVEVNTPLPFGSLATSTAMVKWNKPYDELFVGSSTGIWRFDEDSNQFVSVWPWSWDPVYIRSLGDAIYGSVLNWGAKSGEHIWSPSGDSYINSGSSALRTSLIWADPISKTHGYGDDVVRVISTNMSIQLTGVYSGGDYYHTNSPSGVGPASLIGMRSDGLEIYMNNFYEYSGTNIILDARYSGMYDLFVGGLGGTFYKLNFPTNGSMTTMFYSPSTRLLIAGEAPNVYYTVLPAPDELAGPQLQIQSAVIVSWDSQYNPATLESTANMTGGWQTVTSPQVTVSNQTQVAIPSTAKMFFRLVSP